MEGSSELVAGEDENVAAMAELQERVKQAEEARRKLRELQEVMSLLRGMVGLSHDSGGGGACLNDVHVSWFRTMRPSQTPQSRRPPRNLTDRRIVLNQFWQCPNLRRVKKVPDQ